MIDTCESCVQLSREIGIGSLLCATCEYSQCSICSTVDKPTNTYNGKTYKVLLLGYGGQPICSICKEHQCYLCGQYDPDIDWKEEKLVSYAGKPLCEECGYRNWCNRCGDYDGGCDNRCPECDAVCDHECGCEIECVQCAENFAYDGYDFKSRTLHENILQADLEYSKRTCTECWDADLVA